MRLSLPPSVRLTIRTKLLASALVTVILVTAIALMAIDRLGDVKRTGEAVQSEAVSPAGAALRSATAGDQLKIGYLEFQLFGAQQTPAELKAGLAKAQKLTQFLSQQVKILETTAPERYQDAVAQVSKDAQSLVEQLAAFASPEAAQQTPAQAIASGKRFDDTLASMTGGAQKLAASLSEDVSAMNLEIGESYDSGRTAILLALLLTVLVAIASAVVVSEGIRRGVRSIVARLRSLTQEDTVALRDGLRSVAEGDLTRRVAVVTEPIEKVGRDEIGEVAGMVNAIRDTTVASVAAYHDSLDGLSTLVGQVSHSAAGLTAASQEVARNSQEAGRAVAEAAHAMTDVAHGAERQVEAVAQARTLSAEVGDVTTESVAHAGHTAEAAADARRLADEGVDEVREATHAMAAVREASGEATEAIRRLGEKSQEISTIVDTITSIAQQTNLLALNAAIEAARAGDQGRGFAVVADEVRKLAEESQSAASQIASMLGSVQEDTRRAVEVVEVGAQRTATGAATVERAEQSFLRIGASVEEMTTRAQEIATAIERIASVSTRMQDGMEEVAEVAEHSSASAQQVSASTQQTSASTEEIGTSAARLAQTAEELDELVRRFTLTTAA